MISYYRYVLHRDRPTYEAAGWIVADDFAGCPHGVYAILMKWPGAGEPK